MRTLWAGIRETDVLCHSVGAADTVVHLRTGGQINISDHLVIRALTRDGVVHGFGMVIAQSSNPDATFDHDRHWQYFWLVEGWMMGAGIGPRSCILMYDDELDPVPDAPEQWK
jgi:hypothetical protein